MGLLELPGALPGISGPRAVSKVKFASGLEELVPWEQCCPLICLQEEELM